MFRVLVCTTLLIAGVFANDTSTIIPPPHPIQPTASPNIPTTTKPASTTSKPIITTTATPPITTHAPPTPTPDNKPGIWNVTEDNNKTVACVVATMSINILVPYMKVDTKNTTINATQEISVPSNATASGSCGNTTQTLKLSWKVANATLTLSFSFEKNKSEFTMSSIQANIPADKVLFPGIIENGTEFKLTTVNASAAVPLNQSYLCAAGANFTLVDSANKNATAVPVLILKHVQFQAFANTKENKFDTAVDCANVPYITPDLVPILVGVSLAALVAVVLVAYVIGRKRSAARGYVSM